MKNNTTPKCYNSFSCIGAILIIMFVLGSIIWDILFTKPAMRIQMENFKVSFEVKNIHEKIDSRLAADSISFMEACQMMNSNVEEK